MVRVQPEEFPNFQALRDRLKILRHDQACAKGFRQRSRSSPRGSLLLRTHSPDLVPRAGSSWALWLLILFAQVFFLELSNALRVAQDREPQRVRWKRLTVVLPLAAMRLISEYRSPPLSPILRHSAQPLPQPRRELPMPTTQSGRLMVLPPPCLQSHQAEH